MPPAIWTTRRRNWRLTGRVKVTLVAMRRAWPRSPEHGLILLVETACEEARAEMPVASDLDLEWNEVRSWRRATISDLLDKALRWIGDPSGVGVEVLSEAERIEALLDAVSRKSDEVTAARQLGVALGLLQSAAAELHANGDSPVAEASRLFLRACRDLGFSPDYPRAEAIKNMIVDLKLDLTDTKEPT